MKNQNIKVKLSIVAILSMIVSSGCVQVRNMPTSTAATAPGPHFAQAEAFEANQAFNRAAESYLAIAQNFPQSATALQRLAMCLDKQGLTTQSKPYYLQALTLDPNNADLHCDFGYSSYLQGDLAQAEQSYQTAIRLDANNSRAHNNLAQLLAQTSRMTEAVQHYQLAGCNAEQIRQNIEFAATGIPAPVRQGSKPESQAMVAQFQQPTPLKFTTTGNPTPVSRVSTPESQVMIAEFQQPTPVEAQCPPPVIVANVDKYYDGIMSATGEAKVAAGNVPFPAPNAQFASFEYSAARKNAVSAESSTQNSSRRNLESPQTSPLPSQGVSVQLTD